MNWILAAGSVLAVGLLMGGWIRSQSDKPPKRRHRVGRSIISGVLLAILAGGTCQYQVRCPIHPEEMGILVRVSFVDGHESGVYRCPRGHTFVVACN